VCEVSIHPVGPIIAPAFFEESTVLYRAGETVHAFMRFAGLELLMIRRLVQRIGGTVRLDGGGMEGPAVKLRFKSVETPPPPGKTDEAQTRPFFHVEEPVAPYTEAEESVELLEIADAIQRLESDDEILVHDTSIENDSSRQRVLIGEMNTETQRLVRSLLQPYYDLTIVPNTDELLKEAAREDYDLLLLDVNLQGEQSGIDVLRELRRRPHYFRTPAIAVAAGNATDDEKNLIDRAGFDGFLRKPYSIVELLETVERMIES
jgi:CheY-like chemotaxis protein